MLICGMNIKTITSESTKVHITEFGYTLHISETTVGIEIKFVYAFVMVLRTNI